MRLKKNISTDKLNFEYFINVNKDGLFSAYLPKEIVEKLEQYGIQVAYGRGHRKGFFEAQSLADIENRILKTIQKFSEKKWKMLEKKGRFR